MYKYILSILIVLINVSTIKSQNIIISEDSTATPELNLGAIVVAASKDESQLRKMPTSVSVFSAKSIEQNEVNTLDQLTGLTPGLVMPDYGTKLTSPIYIRGVGSRINSPSVGLYVDNIPYFEKSAFNFDFFDLERVEVLRGPQGTLYGRNSMGGLISINTLSPEDFQGSKVNAILGNYGYANLTAGTYQKVGEQFAFSLNGNYKRHNGFYENVTEGDQVDELNAYSLRNKLIFNPSTKWRIENIFSFEHSTQDGYPYAIFNDSLQKAGEINYNQPSYYNRFMLSDGLSIAYQGNSWQLKTTIAYQLIDDEQAIDQDFTADSAYFVIQAQRQDMFSGEVVAQSRNTEKFKWLIGAFGFQQIFDKSVEVDVYARKTWYLKQYDQTVSGNGLFGQLSYEVINDLNITGGFRIDNEKATLGYNYDLDVAGNDITDLDTIYPEYKDDEKLFKVAADYEIGQSNLYVSYTEGYKPGGYNSTFELPEQLNFKHEMSKNYEVGYKTAFLHNTFFMDMALYFTAIDNQQIYRTVPSGRGSYLDNAGKSENKGFELSLASREIEGFSATATFAYTNAKIIEYVKDSTTNYNGNYTPYVPGYTWSLTMSQVIPTKAMSFIDELKANVLIKGIGESYWDLANNYQEEAYAVIDGKITAQFGKAKVGLWAKNILNNSYNAFLFEALGNVYVQTAKPFQFGCNLSYQF